MTRPRIYLLANGRGYLAPPTTSSNRERCKSLLCFWLVLQLSVDLCLDMTLGKLEKVSIYILVEVHVVFPFFIVQNYPCYILYAPYSQLASNYGCIRVINGVKDMDGFRRAMNLSLVQDEQSNGSLNCGGTDTNENALLVS